MTLLPLSTSDQDLVLFVDSWAALLEQEDYEAAFSLMRARGMVVKFRDTYRTHWG